MKKKFLLATLLVLSFAFIFAIGICADDVAADPYADYYDKVYTAIDGTKLALYEKEGEVNYPLAWFYNSETGKYEEFRVGTEVIFAVSGGTTQIGAGVDFRENADVIFTDATKTYKLTDLILINLQGVKTNMFSGSWTNLPIQAIYCNVGFAYVNGSTFNDNQTLTVFDIPKAHNAKSATICTAFQRCPRLKEIYIPKSVCVLGSAFQESGLEKVEFAADYQPKGLFDWQTTTGKSHWFYKCKSLTTVILPTTSTHTYIGTSTFEECTVLTSINIPDYIVEINSSAFKKCYSLTTVSIPAGFTTIGDYAFQDCQALSSVTFRGDAGANAKFGIGAFERCYVIGTVSIPEGVKTLGNCAFKHAGVSHLTLPTTLTTIEGGSTFMLSGATDKITAEYRLQSVTGLENTQITTIVDSMFRGQSKWKADLIILPNTVTKISSDYAFADVGMSNIRLSAGLTYLGNETFTGCANLKNVYIPGTITTFGSNPFNGKGVYFFVTSSDTTYLDTINAKAGSSNDYVSYADYKANPDNYKSGKYIIYGLNLCETFYNGHDTEGVVGKNQFKGEAYITDYICASGCNRNCGMQAETFLCGPLFENKGYSKIADGTMFTYGIVINEENIAAYVALTGKAFNYGVIVGAANFDSEGNLVEKDAIIDSTGKSLIDNSIVVNFANVALDNFTIYNVKMLGIETEAQRKLPIYCCAYIIDGDAVSYMGNSVTTAAKTISSDAITVIEATTPPTTGEENA